MVGHRIKIAQGDVLQFLLDCPDTKPVCQRRINLHGFKRLIAPLLFGHHLDRAHIVQAVRQLDDDDAYILCHRQKHFPHIFRLLLLARCKADLSEFCHTVDQQRHIGTKLLFNRLACDIRIFHNVMQQRGLDTFAVHTQVDKDNRNRNRMRNIRLAGNAALPIMSVIGKLIGCHDLFAVIHAAAPVDRPLQIVYNIVIHLTRPPLRAEARRRGVIHAPRRALQARAESWIGRYPPCADWPQRRRFLCPRCVPG